MTTEMMANIDNLSISLILGILGIAITVFTVIYSFMETTKERRRVLSDWVRNSNEVNPVMESDLQFAIKRLKELKRMNLMVLAIAFCDIVAFVVYAAHLVFNDVFWLSLTSIVMIAILAVLCIIALVAYLAQYFKRFRGL
jgi:hypothetical protein